MLEQKFPHINVIGLVQEQHPARTRLFQQWHGLDWPIMVDSLNLLEVTVVPITLWIGADGTILKKLRRPNRFRPTSSEVDSPSAPPAPEPEKPSDGGSTDAEKARQLGDYWFRRSSIDEAHVATAIAAYTDSLERDPKDGRTHFRLGVAFERRYHQEDRSPNDFKRALDHWTRALALRPDNYIWRRRLQQYGPRLDKPYPFYNWVDEARRAIIARGETPITLPVTLTDSESLGPSQADEAVAAVDPDPKAKVPGVKPAWIAIETAAAPSIATAGKPVRVYLTLRPRSGSSVHWNNEAEPMAVWVQPTEGTTIESHLQSFTPAPKRGPDGKMVVPAIGAEPRRVEFEVTPDLTSHRDTGTVTIHGYVLFNACEDEGGTCRYLRQEWSLDLPVATPHGPKPADK